MKVEVVYIDDILLSKTCDRERRLVNAEVLVSDEGDEGRIMHVCWPAYGKDHYTASVEYSNKLAGRLNHSIAHEISMELKKFVGEACVDED